MWHPDLQSGPLPLYERLVLTMARDIQTGLLAPGAKLPPQRDLAFRLGVSVGSVTRAYAEAERRGLLSAHVGRGSFVRGVLPAVPDVPAVERGTAMGQGRSGVIDLRCNTPPPVPLMPELKTALATLMARGALDPAVHYIQGAGLPHVRAAGAQWIARHYGLDFDAGHLIQCNGGQHGIALVFSSFCSPGDTVLCESSTFYGARMAADHLGLKLRGVAMDDDGLLPEALDRAAAETGSTLLFTLPTLHNPTTRTMSEQRRQEIAAVARARDLLILEDDAYYAYSERPRQILSYAPDRTLYLASLSKGVCPGFRLAFLALPPHLPRERLMRGIRALGYCPPALGALVFSQWVADGRIDAIAQAVQAEASARWDLARSMLGAFIARPGASHSPHAWLPMSALEAERVTARLLRAGVEVTPPDASSVSPQADTGLRLCLGAPEDRDELGRALGIIAGAITGHGSVDRDGII
ncbi:aminotransferase-like domain-containing protein [Acidomonas methanolica]|uniref:Transcriptional regulator MocR/GntR n=1 Tax=Acidomonas methanolica NBRC 104435 TaxID=1231351 RepID=A0A023D7F9_ACIMT|nr:PLP-dependent aminotransferase family protein [Acidomonas methanolica]MBU2655429.1 PLP-dependent aminotransferase family protein [Acidomonas methanolica]TCS23312.1 GntR family transcriptional regulator [Acidomonas methanolica]GAJ29701.1 transcriptional regulator MocR/GntR [Acidomonas methanolica NBRC 104435]GBQ50127.1 GntR family transcriptional regulator [Acidomonas methanolica]GEL00255.1 GntR family transcriptional regulator [Acidomonas methanolica NBRC 104435]